MLFKAMRESEITYGISINREEELVSIDKPYALLL